jgi:hypothetical protein
MPRPRRRFTNVRDGSRRRHTNLFKQFGYASFHVFKNQILEPVPDSRHAALFTSNFASNPNAIVNIAADRSGSSTSEPARKSSAPPSGDVLVFSSAGWHNFTSPAAVKLAADNRRSSALM